MSDEVKVTNKYDEIFQIEIDGWCYGLKNYPGEVYATLVYAVVRELGVCYRCAIAHNYVFNVADLAKRLSKAAKYLVPEKDIAFCILTHLPNPAMLDNGEQVILSKIVEQTEAEFPGARDVVRNKWNWEDEKINKARAKRAA